ncbi:MAG: shikimate kinase [Balneolaceae bacterium]
MGNKDKQTYFICGMMGSGKSAIGSALAEKLGVPFKDLDQIIEQSTGMQISEIFKTRGELFFRKTEKTVLIQQLSKGNGVLALGGGSLQNQYLTDLVKRNGILIFIDTPIEYILKRIKKNKKRPLIVGLDETAMEQRIQNLLDERLPFYSQAHITVPGGESNKYKTADLIISKLECYDA